MRMLKTVSAVVVATVATVTVLVSGSLVRAQDRLAPQDYIDIQQLVARYPYALDTGENEGRAWASLFTADGEFVSPAGTLAGRRALSEFANGHRPGQGPLYARNFSTNVWIEPSAGGATGKVYAVVINIGEGGDPSSIVTGGHFEDVYVKTNEGWRIKRREFVPSVGGPEPPAR